ncbi:hypothetical protein BX589_10259 [Paraburkholderia fungorum]|jgi:hypothetical protein|uniref:hypothetical protein n=1 Tax=Paraburkholderia fungorum TaxID=134537 RepID=UPI000D481993|nr:hypothetical protein [Paraburkholderia fungorum]PRZ55864.1 hypothetical protein BX589_10259 [Paraburkholderia fungorum]
MGQSRKAELNLARQKLSQTGFVKISLKNHLCLVALRDGCAENFHLGTIVRTAFESFFLARSGFGTLDLAIYAEVGDRLAEFHAVSSRRENVQLSPDSALIVGRLLAVFDKQLLGAPLNILLSAYEQAENNFNAKLEERKSLNSLVAIEQVRRMYERRTEPALDFGSVPLL